MLNIPEKTIAARYKKLDSSRTAKLERSRYCASLTVPTLLPPLGWTEESQLPQPFSSVAARGVTSMASRMLSALLPLNDTPFFKFAMKNGSQPEAEIREYLENLNYQVYNKLSAKNLRDTLYQVLQHLIVVGDVLLIMEDDFTFRTARLDQYVCRRDVQGDVKELIYLEFQAAKNQESADELFSGDAGALERNGYRTVYCRLTKEENIWKMRKEDNEGTLIQEGEYIHSPFIVLRWTSIAGENYGRSHCEDIIGDIKTLEAFTEGLIQGIAAGSTFWVGVDPAGITEINDIAGAANGAIIGARQQDIFTISPSGTMTPQINSTQTGVAQMRQALGQAFLMDSASMPKGERVTATAVRMIGQELEHVLGGAFSSIARSLMKPIISRSIFLMIASSEIDPRMAEEFTSEGDLIIEIITGLQALSRDSDLQRLMQMGEMVRNLPEQAASMFKWDEYGRALITSLGFNPENWVKSEDIVKEKERQQAEHATQMQGQAQQQAMIGQLAQQAAMQDIQTTGGEGVAQVMEQIGGQI